MAGHWIHLDTGFFALDLPSEWHTEERPNGRLFLRSLDGQVTLDLHAVSKARAGEPASPRHALSAVAGEPASREPATGELFGELGRWVRSFRQVLTRQRPRLVPHTAHPTATLEGVEPQGWWGRLLVRGPRCRFWATRNDHMLVLARCAGEAGAVERLRAEVDGMLASLRLPERDLLVGRPFAEAVERLARHAYPKARVALIDDVHLRFGSREVSLVGLQRRYLEAPEDLARHVRRYLSELSEPLPGSSFDASFDASFDPSAGAPGATPSEPASPASSGRPDLSGFPELRAAGEEPGSTPTDPPDDVTESAWIHEVSGDAAAEAPAWDEAGSSESPSREYLDVRDQVMPMLVNNAGLSKLSVDALTEPWVNQLHLAYVLDDHGTTRPITRSDVRRWCVDPETLHEQALQNLVYRSHELTMEGSRCDGYTMLALATPDAFNASRVLLPDLHKKLREHLGNTFYAAVPSREFLLAFSSEREDVLQRVRQQIASDFCRAANGVSPKLFLVTPDGIAGDPEEAEDLDEILQGWKS